MDTMASTNPFTTPEIAVPGTDDTKPNVISSRTGATFSKAGQRFGDGVLKSIVAAYSNVVYNPFYVALYVTALVTLFADKPGQTGLLEYLQNKFNTTATATTSSNLTVILATLMYVVFTTIISVKAMFVSTVLWWFPVMLKPSNYNVMFATIGTLIIFTMPSVPSVALVLLSQCFFLYTQLRDPKFKFFIIFMIAIGVYASFATVNKTYYEQLTRKLENRLGIPSSEQLGIKDLVFHYTQSDSYIKFKVFHTVSGSVVESHYQLPFSVTTEILNSPSLTYPTDTLKTYKTDASANHWTVPAPPTRKPEEATVPPLGRMRRDVNKPLSQPRSGPALFNV